MAIAAVLALLGAAGVVYTFGGPRNVPTADGGGMITAAAAERAGATVLPTINE
jgi:hypothetical protein